MSKSDLALYTVKQPIEVFDASSSHSEVINLSIST